MPRLVWGQTQDRKYETGIDHGVLYPLTDPGVVWNGLVSIEQSSVGGEVNSYYFDGIKYVDLVNTKNFQATLTAFSAPREFSPSNGDISVVPGFILTRQPRVRFGLSYRTLVDSNGRYRLHLVYNAIATQQGRGHSTLDDTATITPVSWLIDATPPASDGFRPSAHFILDSSEIDPVALQLIEDVLYGSDTREPRLPSFTELFDIMVLGEPFVIVPDLVDGLADLESGVGDLYETSVDGVYRALPETRLFETTTSGLYGLEL